MKKKYWITNLCWVFILLTACDTKIEISHPEVSPMLVAYSTSTPYHVAMPYPSEIEVHLSQLHSLNEPSTIDTIADALVIVKGREWNDTLLYTEESNSYVTHRYLTEGETYELAILHDGYPTITATDILPKFIKPDTFLIEPYIGCNSDGVPLGSVYLSFSDPIGEPNYYEIVINKGETVLSSSDAAITSENYYPEIPELKNYQTGRLLFSDKSFLGKQKSLLIRFYPPYSESSNGERTIYGSNLEVSFRNVSYNYYQYYTSLLDFYYNMQGDVLMGMAEPKDIYSNIENGIGLFGLYNSYFESKYIEKTNIKQ